MDPRLLRVVEDPGYDRAVGLWSKVDAHAGSNPDAVNDKLLWWRDALFAALRVSALPSAVATPLSNISSSTAPDAQPTSIQPASRLILHIDESVRRLWTRDDVGPPSGLGIVVQKLETQGDLCSYRAFLDSPTPLHLIATKGKVAPKDERGLARRAVGAVGGMAAAAAMEYLTRALSAFGFGDEAKDEEEAAWELAKGDWVAVSLLNSAAQQLQDSHFARAGVSPLDVLYTKEEVARLLVAPVLSKWTPDSLKDASTPTLAQEDLDVLLLHLSRDLKAIAIKDNVIKFPSRAGEQVTPVTKHEQDVVQVRLTHSQLEAQVSSLQQQVDACTERAKKAVANKQASMARNQLKSRKMLIGLLEKRMAAENNLGTVLLKLDQVSTDAKLAETYESASDALAHVLADPRLQLDRVEKTMDRLHEGVQDAQEVSDAIAAPGPGAAEVDEDEIAAELAALEEEARPASVPEPVSQPTPEHVHVSARETAPTPTPVPAAEHTTAPALEPSTVASTEQGKSGVQSQPPSTNSKDSSDLLPSLPSVPQAPPGEAATTKSKTPSEVPEHST